MILNVLKKNMRKNNNKNIYVMYKIEDLTIPLIKLPNKTIKIKKNRKQLQNLMTFLIELWIT